MHVLALADALTAALAVVAILLGLLIVARGRRGESADEQAGQSLLSVPVVVPGTATAAAHSGDEADAGGGLQTMAVGEVGHGAIRLGPITRPVPAPAATPAPPAEPDPGPTPDPPPPTAEPDPPVDPPVSWTAHPAPPLPPANPEPVPDRTTAREEAAGESPPQAPEQPPAEDPPPPGPDPPPVPFRQGRIRLRKPSE